MAYFVLAGTHVPIGETADTAGDEITSTLEPPSLPETSDIAEAIPQMEQQDLSVDDELPSDLDTLTEDAKVDDALATAKVTARSSDAIALATPSESISSVSTETPVPSLYEETEWKRILDKELERLALGWIVFNPPRNMKVGVEERIEVRLTRGQQARLLKGLKGRGLPQMDVIKLGPLMRVRLAGDDTFDLKSRSEEEQIVEDRGYTEWAWDVVPQEPGKHKLSLLVTVRIRLPYGEEKKDLLVKDKHVWVEINPVYTTKRFIQEYWQWTIATLVLPFVIWLVKESRKRPRNAYPT